MIANCPLPIAIANCPLGDTLYLDVVIKCLVPVN